MQSDNMIKALIGAIIGLIVFSAFALPLLTSEQVNLGESATLANTANNGTNYTYEIWDGSDITMKYTASTGDGGTYTIDGVEVEFLTYDQRIVLASNDFATRSGGAAGNVNLNSQYVDNPAQLSNMGFTFTVVNKEYTLEFDTSPDTTTYTGAVDWMVYATAGGDAGLIQLKTPTSPFYTSTSNDIIVLGNIYTTGDNDTFYSYYKGDLTVNDTYAENSSVTITKTLKDGYTDIYDTTLSVNIGDESFVPYFILAPGTVNGHTASGTMYELVGLLPLLLVVVLVLGVIGIVARSRLS